MSLAECCVLKHRGQSKDIESSLSQWKRDEDKTTTLSPIAIMACGGCGPC